MAERLKGKSAVVTGASSGMGRAIALAYVKEGANIVAAARNTEELALLEKEVADLGLSDQFRYIRCDVTKDEDCERAVKLCVDSFGTCNVLSHNAGVADNFSLLEEVTDEMWNRMIDVNLTGTMRMCRAALKYFLANEVHASIVMITSNAAFESATGGPAYCASKAGANALMKAIAFEYGRKGIRCNSICPGPVMTNIHKSMGERSAAGTAVHHQTGYNAHYREWAVKPVGLPEDIAPMSVYLASDESNFVNSSSFIVDGGVCLG
ncbi:MAG: SDR family NAD(P)-dependent oxidoreductase [Blautia sp.]